MGFEPIRLSAPPPQDGKSTSFSTRPNLCKQKKLSNSLTFCDPAGIRTQDPIIKSDVLYQLSYRVNKKSFPQCGCKYTHVLLIIQSLSAINFSFF